MISTRQFPLVLVAILVSQAQAFQTSSVANPRNRRIFSWAPKMSTHKGVNGSTETKIQWNKKNKQLTPTRKAPMKEGDLQIGNEVIQDNKEKKVGFVRAFVVAVPLVFKLSVVLGIKFLMDLIVFPLLFFYRFLMLVKTKTMGLFQGSATESPSKTTPNFGEQATTHGDSQI